MTEIEFKRYRAIQNKLTDFGFVALDNGYVYHTDIINGQMSMTVRIDGNSKIYTEVIDKSTDEEYVLHRVSGASGSFVGQVKSEYEAILEEICAKCFDFEVFKSDQAKEIIDYIRNKYGDELEFLWQKFPDNAVVRRKDNQKWYAAILTVLRRKLGLDSDESVEILDLRMKPDDIEKSVDNVKYFPGYHMNKKHWVTICLDGTVSTEEILARIDNSYELAAKK